MDGFEKKARSLLLRAGALCVLLGGVWIFFRFLLRPTLPFGLGLLLALFVLPLSEKLEKRRNVPRKVAATALLLFGTAAIAAICIFSAGAIFKEVSMLLGRGQDVSGALEQARKGLLSFLDGKLPFFADLLSAQREEALLQGLFSTLSSSLARLAFSLPDAIFFLVSFVLSAFYFSFDGRELLHKFYDLLPPETARKLGSLIRTCCRAVFGYLRAGGKIMLLTFLLLLTAFLLLGVSYPLLLAAFIAAVDFLPVLGTGVVLAPWSVLCFLSGKTAKGLWLLAIWGGASLLRQFAEPKVMGQRLEMHPLFSLLSSYAGLKLFGIPGMVLLPVVASVGWGIYKEYRLTLAGEEQKRDPYGGSRQK